jgi:long-chain acyl-CoA synthetase
MNVGDILTASARVHPDRTALVWDEGGGRRTYAELNRRAGALASALATGLGVRPGDRVALMMYNGPTLLEALFAVWKAGATVVPLNARFTADEVAYHVADSGARVLIGGRDFAETLTGMRERIEVETLVLEGGGDGAVDLDALAAEHAGRPAPAVRVADSDVAWIAYTSGTTGRPKGAMLSHGCLTYVAVTWLADLQRLEPEDVGLYAAPLTHGAGIMALAFTMKACTQVLLQPFGFDPQRFLDTIRRERVTHTWLVPTQIKMVLDHPGLAGADLSTVRTIVYGGAPMHVEHLKEAIRRIGPVFVQLFAQTESPMTATYLRREEHVLEGPGSERLASCGHVRSGMEVAILDAEDRPLGPDEVGEICVRGPALMNGYWERPEATAETLRNGWLHTGDIGRLDEHGYLFIMDRSKDMLISGGLNVYPREIEEVLLRHPAVSECAVIGIPDERWGETAMAVVVRAGGEEVSETELKDFAGEHLAHYKKPRAFEFVTALPKTTYGKIDKKALRAPHWAGRERMV